MSVEDLIDRYQIVLSGDHTKLKLFNPPDTDEERDVIRAAKQDIIEYIEKEEKMMLQRINNRSNIQGILEVKRCINNASDLAALDEVKTKYPQAAAFVEIENLKFEDDKQLAKLGSYYTNKFLNDPSKWEEVYEEFKNKSANIK